MRDPHNHLHNAIIREGLHTGRIQRVQSGQNIDAEQLLLLRPDLVLTSVSGNPATTLPQPLQRTGLPIVYTTSFMETHPLGRAE